MNKNGNASPCCWFRPLKAIPIIDYLTNTEIVDVKRKFLNNEWPVQCTICKNSEDLHGYSGRQLSNAYESSEDAIMQHNNENYFNINNIDIITSNICNLNCIMCYGGSFKKDTEMYGLGLINSPPIIKTMSAEHAEYLFNSINMTQLQTVNFIGGEPFGDKIAMNIISKLIETGYSSNLVLHINSNLTLITKERILWLKANFKDILIKCSIDGYDNVDEYIRYPTKWDTIVQVLDMFQQHEIPFIITTALSNLSLLRYYELVNWVYTKFDNIPEMFLTVVTSPSELACNLLPNDIKERLLVEYQKLKCTYSSKLSSRNTLAIDTCINLCAISNDDKIVAFHETIEYMKKYETVRKNNYLAVWPELANYVY